MPAPANTDELLELVKKSGVLDEARLTAYVEKLRSSSAMPAEPDKLAALMVREAMLTYFQSENLLKGRWRRYQIGKYKILERLGAGGMGSVYLCEHKFMRRRAAVKVLPEAKAKDPSSLERFYREARAVAALDHPNIVRAYDIDQDDNLHFLVMEYVDGASLQEIIRRTGAMTPLRAAHYVFQSALGLQHAHETAALVHRDIKPGNILVDRWGTVKVLDMGLARFFNDELDQITIKYDESVLGTADYLAPEQALDSHKVDIRADIYSLGATFYYCLTGRTPFQEGTVAQKLIWHQTRQPKPVKSYRDDVPDKLLAILDKMMAKQPEDRYQTPGELAEVLRPFTQTPIPPPPEEEMPKLSPAAAQGTNSSEVGSNQRLPGLVNPPPSSKHKKSNWQVPTVPAPKSNPEPVRTKTPAPVRRPEPRPVAVDPAPPNATRVQAKVSNAPTAKNAAVNKEDESVPWEKLAAETVDPSAKVDTDSKGSPKKAVPKPTDARPTWLKRFAFVSRMSLRERLWLLTGGAVLVVGIALVLWYWFTREPPRSGPATSPTTPSTTTWVVSRSGAAGTVTTLERAVSLARPGDHIVVQEDIEETLLFDGVRRLQRDITIEAASPGINWRMPKQKNEDRFIVLSDARGVKIRGFVLDGQDQAKDLIVLTGNCPGLVLEELTLQGFQEAAIKIVNCAGTSTRPVLLAGLRIHSRKPTDAGFVLHVNPAVKEPALNQYLALRGCFFTGPSQNPVVATAPGVYEDVEFRDVPSPTVKK